MNELFGAFQTELQMGAYETSPLFAHPVLPKVELKRRVLTSNTYVNMGKSVIFRRR